MDCASELEIRLGLPEHLRRPAAEIMYQAFHREFDPILGSQEHGVAILERSFCPESVMIALCGNQIAGVAGLQYTGQRLFDLKLSTFIHEYGWLQGLLRLVPFSFYASSPQNGDLYLAGIAVRASMRGQGIGTRLLQAVCDLARAKQIGSVQLQVVDTNADARRLYERMGFVATKTSYYPYLRHIMGFTAAITMVKKVD